MASPSPPSPDRSSPFLDPEKRLVAAAAAPALSTSNEDAHAVDGAVLGLDEEGGGGGGEDILARQDLDPVLNLKMHLVNNAIDEIGWTGYHWKLFVLNGFGYAVDSLVLLLQSVVAPQAFLEFGNGGYDRGQTIAGYVGMLTGAIFWGLSADIIGRRFAFNVSLFVCSVSAVIAGAMSNWAALGVFIALVGFGAGGNLILDTTVFLEYLPGNKQWVLTFLACWWGVGQAVTGFIAWGFMAPPEWNCASTGTEACTKENNMGWRYTMYTAGTLVFVLSILRITVIRLRETPKYLLGTGADEQLMETLHFLAQRYDRPCSLTLARLSACGVVQGTHDSTTQQRRRFFSLGESLIHVRGLFATRQMAVSTGLVWLSWTLIGLAYPLFYVFLSSYLESRGASFTVSTYDTWRNYTLVNISGIFGPMLAGWMCNQPILGRRYTMVIGALVTSAFFFAYTAVRTPQENVGFSCAIGFCLNIYYGTLYAYTPEVLPSAHRATGNGVAVACNRIMGMLSALIATLSNTSTPVPIYICAALFIAMAAVSASFPFEPFGRRSS